MEIAENARKHGIHDEDMRHAVRVPVALVRQDERRVLVIGASRDGVTMLEVVVLQDPDEEPVIIHADVLRPKFHKYL